jgi:hypothetical protein
MVSEASNVLLSTLINLLQCNFATAANSEDIFSAEPASQESSLDKKIIYVFGGSNMKKVIPHLDSQRFEIRDHTIPGWLPNTANIDILAKTLETAEKDSIALLDLLGNVAYRYTQCDGTLALPYKTGGKYHFEGEIRLLSLHTLSCILANLKPALSNAKCTLALLAPLPRHLHDSCCECGDHCTNVGKEGHAEKLLGELSGIRTALENNLNALGVKNFSVPDTLKLMMPACVGISEMSLALKHFIKKDGVHFTEDGTKCLANALSSHAVGLASGAMKQNSAGISAVSGGKQRTYYWRGFVSPVGTSRPASHGGRNQAMPPQNSGGKWPKGRASQYKAPYMGGPQGGRKVKK